MPAGWSSGWLSLALLAPVDFVLCTCGETVWSVCQWSRARARTREDSDRQPVGASQWGLELMPSGFNIEESDEDCNPAATSTKN